MTALLAGHEGKLLVDGELITSSSGSTFENVDPATEEVLGVAADAAPEDVDRAIGAARRAFDTTSWSEDHTFRLYCLEQLRNALDRARDELREVVVREAGCPVSLARGSQVDAVPGEVSRAIVIAENYPWEVESVDHPTGQRAIVRRSARGVVAAITPFNFPLALNVKKVVPALAAGNTVVLTPSAYTPWSATTLAQLVKEQTDIPAGVFNVVTGSGPEVGRALSEDPRVDMVTFVGSSPVGRRIMAQAAGSLKKLVLELGGKSASIILDDADIDSAAAVAAGVAVHAGQGCSRLTRFLVPTTRYQEMVEATLARFRLVAYGDPWDPDTVQGPQISAAQQSRVVDMIRRAQGDGAVVAHGGGVPKHLPKGYFVEPTLLINVDPKSEIAQEEVFGPVAVLISFRDDADAIAIANDSPYGLSGAVTSSSLDRALAVARRIRTGQMVVNGAQPSMDMPFGGYKQSGLGRDSGIVGFEEHLETQVLGVPATAR